MFKTYYQCFSGSELVDWIFSSCNFLVKEEAIKLARQLVDEQFILDVNETKEGFKEGSLFVIQSCEYWPTSGIAPSEEEYLVHLATLHHFLSSIGKTLTHVQQSRYKKMKIKFAERAEEFDQLAAQRAK